MLKLADDPATSAAIAESYVTLSLQDCLYSFPENEYYCSIEDQKMGNVLILP